MNYTDKTKIVKAIGTDGGDEVTKAVAIGGNDGTNFQVLKTNADGELVANLETTDIEIGAVELKNAATDDRALVSDANTARAATNHVLSVQHLDAAGNVLPSGAAVGTASFVKITDGVETLLISAAGSAAVDIISEIPAGTQLIGKAEIDQTTPGTTNAVAPISGQAGIAAGTGVDGVTVPRVTLATDIGLPVIQSNDTFLVDSWCAEYAETNQDTDIKLVGIGATADNTLGQGFKPIAAGDPGLVRLWIKRTGTFTLGDLTVEIQTDTTGDPSGTPVANGTSAETVVSGIGTSYEWVEFTFATNPTLVAGTQYHVVLKGNADYISEYAADTAFVQWGVDQSSPGYTDGVFSTGTDDGSWGAYSPAGDGCFEVHYCIGEGETASVIGVSEGIDVSKSKEVLIVMEADVENAAFDAYIDVAVVISCNGTDYSSGAYETLHFLFEGSDTTRRMERPLNVSAASKIKIFSIKVNDASYDLTANTINVNIGLKE